MRALAAVALALITLTTAACSLQQTKTRTIHEPTQTQTITIERQALDWSMTSSYYASPDVTLSYPLCPRQKRLGKPVVRATAQSVAITLWATPKKCSEPQSHSLTIHLDAPLGNRPITNPGLLP